MQYEEPHLPHPRKSENHAVRNRKKIGRLHALVMAPDEAQATILDSIKWNNYPPSPPPSPKAMMKARRSKKSAILASLKWGEGWSRCSIYFVQDNLGQYKVEQLSPIPPKAMMKARRSKKRAILASLKWGEGWFRCSIYFVQDCSSTGKVLETRLRSTLTQRNQRQVLTGKKSGRG